MSWESGYRVGRKEDISLARETMNTATYTADTMADMAADTTAITDISGYGNCSQRSSYFEVHQ